MAVAARASHALAGSHQRVAGGHRNSRPFRTIPDSELNAEVDAQAHEQRYEGHRNEVEAVEDQKPAGARRREPYEHRHQYRHDEAG